MKIYFIKKDNYRLCQDGKWREHVPFGSCGNCLKEYKRKAFASKKAEKVQGQVVEINTTFENMDAAGNIFEYVYSRSS